MNVIFKGILQEKYRKEGSKNAYLTFSTIVNTPTGETTGSLNLTADCEKLDLSTIPLLVPVEVSAVLRPGLFYNKEAKRKMQALFIESIGVTRV